MRTSLFVVLCRDLSSNDVDGLGFEFQAGADMARYFVKEQLGSRYFILSGGASMGNEMHYQRTLGILDTLSAAYGVSFPQSRYELAGAA